MESVVKVGGDYRFSRVGCSELAVVGGGGAASFRRQLDGGSAYLYRKSVGVGKNGIIFQQTSFDLSGLLQCLGSVRKCGSIYTKHMQRHTLQDAVKAMFNCNVIDRCMRPTLTHWNSTACAPSITKYLTTNISCTMIHSWTCPRTLTSLALSAWGLELRGN